MTNQTEQGANPERAAFEAWAKADNYSVERRGDNYAYTDTRDLWKGWQARAAVPTSEGCTSVAKVREAVDLLERITSGSCSCLTKTPDPHHHKTGCQYKMIREAIDLLEPATPGSHQHD